MTRISNKDKIQLLPITSELVIEILSDTVEPFSFSSISDLYNDSNVPREKISKFIQEILELTRKKYIKLDMQQDGRIFLITSKWKWNKFHQKKWWQSWAVISAIIIGIAGIVVTIICSSIATQINPTLKDQMPILSDTVKINNYQTKMICVDTADIDTCATIPK